MQLTGIVGREVFVVYCWLRHSVSIVAVTDSADAEDPEWEKRFHERSNNTLIESKFIDGILSF